MKYRKCYWALGLSLLLVTSLSFAHEMTGWIAPLRQKDKEPCQIDKVLYPEGERDL